MCQKSCDSGFLQGRTVDLSLLTVTQLLTRRLFLLEGVVSDSQPGLSLAARI